MARSFKQVLRFVMWPFFQLITVLVIALVGVSLYTLYVEVNTADSTTGFLPISSVRTTSVLPTNFTASDGSYIESIRLAWNEVPGATGYRVYRSTVLNGRPCEDGVVVTVLSNARVTAYTENIPSGAVRRYQIMTVFPDGKTTCSQPDNGTSA